MVRINMGNANNPRPRTPVSNAAERSFQANPNISININTDGANSRRGSEQQPQTRQPSPRPTPGPRPQPGPRPPTPAPQPPAPPTPVPQPSPPVVPPAPRRRTIPNRMLRWALAGMTFWMTIAGVSAVAKRLFGKNDGSSHLRDRIQQQAVYEGQQQAAQGQRQQSPPSVVGRMSELFRDPLVYGNQQGGDQQAGAEQQIILTERTGTSHKLPTVVDFQHGQHKVVFLHPTDLSKTTAVEFYYQNDLNNLTRGFTKMAGPGFPATVHLLATPEKHDPGTAIRLDCDRGGVGVSTGRPNSNTFVFTPDKDVMFLMAHQNGALRELKVHDLSPAQRESALRTLSQLPDQSRNSYDIGTRRIETVHKFAREDGGR